MDYDFLTPLDLALKFLLSHAQMKMIGVSAEKGLGF